MPGPQAEGAMVAILYARQVAGARDHLMAMSARKSNLSSLPGRKPLASRREFQFGFERLEELIGIEGIIGLHWVSSLFLGRHFLFPTI